MRARPDGQRPPSSRLQFVAALAFGVLVLLTPFMAYGVRDQIGRGGIVGLLTLFAVSAVLLALSIACLALFLRAHAQAIVPPDHTELDTRASAEEALLMRAFTFDPDDLRANRAGTLSERQRRNLRAGRMSMASMAATMLGVTYLGLALLPTLFGRSGSTGLVPADRTGLWIGVAVVTALIAGAFVYTYRLIKDQLHGRMSVAEGIARDPGDEGDGHPASRSVPTIRIGAVAVPVLDAAQRQALRPGRIYRVFYVRAPIAVVLSLDPR